MKNTDMEVAANNNMPAAVVITARENFLKELNTKPEHTMEKDGIETVPISALETTLDEVYLGMWSKENFRYQVIANEIVGTIDLKVFDPVVKVWLTRSGSAAVMIRQRKDAAITDISAKIKNGLAMDFPKLESMCLKAAAKSLGKKFGRDLNRKFEDDYETTYSNQMELEPIKQQLQDALGNCTSIDELKKVWAEYEVLHENPEMKKLFTSHRIKLQFNVTNK